MREKRNSCRISVGKSDGKRLLRRYARRWEDNIKINITEIGWSGIYRIELSQDRD
jgi:hypothetical protein